MTSGHAAILAAVLAAAAAPAPDAVAPAARPIPGALAESLRTEIHRALAGLALEGFEKPYYVSASVTAARVAVVESAARAPLARRDGEQRVLRVTVRVGSRRLDNSGWLDETGGRGTGEVIASFPLEDDPLAMRRTLWLALDRAYKDAGSSLQAKRSYLASRAEPAGDAPGDFSSESARRDTEEKPAGEVSEPANAADPARLEALAAGLAAALDDPAASCRFRLYTLERRFTFVDTDGAEATQTSTLAALEAACWQEPDASLAVRDIHLRYARDLAGLGPADELARSLRELHGSVQAAAAAPALAEPYQGPVLFEGMASAQLFAALLQSRLGEPREPLSASGHDLPSGEWSSRLGSRVLHASLSVADDPAATSHGGAPLLGGYRVDLEGVHGRRVDLITGGVLRDFLGTRWPRQGVERSNGHARLGGGAPWSLGATPMPSNLLVTAAAADAVAPAEARARLLAEAAARGLPFALVVRRLDDSSIQRLGASDWIEGMRQARGDDSELEAPVAAYRVYADGREERVRGVRFGRVPPEALRDVLAVTPPGSGEAVFTYPLTFDFTYTSAGPLSGAMLPITVVAPGMVVLEEVEVRPIEGPFPVRPIARSRQRRR